MKIPGYAAPTGAILIAAMMLAACGAGADNAASEAFCANAPKQTCARMIAAAKKHVGGGAKLEAYMRNHSSYFSDLTEKQKEKSRQAFGEISADTRNAANIAVMEAAVQGKFACEVSGLGTFSLAFGPGNAFETDGGWTPEPKGTFEAQSIGRVLFNHPGGNYVAGPPEYGMSEVVKFFFPSDDAYRTNYSTGELHGLGSSALACRRA